MTPFFFGSRRRRLFGVFQPALGTRARRTSVVICPPWGGEYLFTHRSLRRLSVMLNEAGFDTLRFDYFGTGDSGGDMIDGDVDGWIGDIETAMDEVRSIANIDEVALIGLRLGGSLAAEVCARRRQRPVSLVLWNPIATGAEYPAELLVACENNARLHEPREAKRPKARAIEAGGGFDYDGFPMSAALARDLERLDLTRTVAALPARTLLLLSGEAERFDDTLAALAARPEIVDGAIRVPGRPHWIEDWPSQRQDVPTDALRAIEGWMA